MLRLVGVVVSIGLADCLNPTTIGPALYLAAGDRARRRVTEFSAAVFLVYFLGGALIALGPGQLILSLVPKPDSEDRYILEIIAGAAMIVAAALLWRYRGRLAERRGLDVPVERKSGAVLGATITAVELPTAFPYFAAIAAIVGSGLSPLKQLFLLLLFNICFILPLLGIVATLTFAPARAEQLLGRGRDFLQRHWPEVLAVLLAVAGLFVVTLGVTGFFGRGQSRLSRFLRHVRKLLHP